MDARPDPAAPAAVSRGLPTVGVPEAPSTSALGRVRGLRPVLWLLVALVSLWPLTGEAVVAAGLILVGAAAAVAADRDPGIVAGRGTARRVALLAVTALSGLGAVLVEPRGLGYVSAFVAATMVARHVTDVRVIAAFAGVLTVLVAAVMAAVSDSPWAMLAAIAVPLLASRGYSRARFQREHARVVALLAERDALRGAELAAAAAEERARIARDLHDVLAHTLSGLSLHLQAIRAVLARRSDSSEDPVLAQVDRAADLARSGLAEAKEAVAALRAEHPASGRADVERLAAEAGAALMVAGDLDACPGPWRDAAVATVREGLTNAARHAPGAATRVDVDAREGLVVRVSDDGPGSGREPVEGGVGGGHGLAGLAERAALVGGDLAAGPDPGGSGWRVTLRVPAGDRAGLPGRVSR
ncbi:histidine kinase [Actinomycetospora sp. NBRC 106375]|uniref:sensor histidine kinase n=1 Tax=Actinomycetospora sp. NBRC 106375 TaxID=3032207 RepID=UPI0025540C13|nr:histidine kinase [Actinomycetospora sp. NBRC 106375]